jgi:hypothetical protein
VVYKAVENDNCHLKMLGFIFLFVVVSTYSMWYTQTKLFIANHRDIGLKLFTDLPTSNVNWDKLYRTHKICFDP